MTVVARIPSFHRQIHSCCTSLVFKSILVIASSFYLHRNQFQDSPPASIEMQMWTCNLRTASFKIDCVLKPKPTGHIFIQEKCRLIISDMTMIYFFIQSQWLNEIYPSLLNILLKRYHVKSYFLFKKLMSDIIIYSRKNI